jgi:hypothetical protein
VAECKQYIDDLYETRRLEPVGWQTWKEMRFDGFGGLQMQETTSPEYKELFDYLRMRREQARADGYPDAAQ